MDGPTLKKWRKELRFTQEEAAKLLDVSRATIQNWEHEVTALPGAIDFACQQCVRRWKQRPDFGPVLLVYADSPGGPPSSEGHDFPPLLHCEPYPNNEAAIQRVLQLRRGQNFVYLWILEEGEHVVWDGTELLLEFTESHFIESDGMDAWDLKKWRKKLGYNQFEAAEQLGVGRASIQNWEQELWPIPRITELACQEILRLWKQRPDFGPVLLVYPDGPIWQRSEGPYDISILQCELHANNEIAMQHVYRLREDPYFINPFIIERTGEIIWTTSDLLLARRAKTSSITERPKGNKAQDVR